MADLRQADCVLLLRFLGGCYQGKLLLHPFDHALSSYALLNRACLDRVHELL